MCFQTTRGLVGSLALYGYIYSPALLNFKLNWPRSIGHTGSASTLVLLLFNFSFCSFY
jgi:hypothetical protein